MHTQQIWSHRTPSAPDGNRNLGPKLIVCTLRVASVDDPELHMEFEDSNAGANFLFSVFSC